MAPGAGVGLLGEPLAVRPSFDALLERVFRNFTGIGLPKTGGPEGLSVEVILTPEVKSELGAGSAFTFSLPIQA
jgi:hypothetical protein